MTITLILMALTIWLIVKQWPHQPETVANRQYKRWEARRRAAGATPDQIRQEAAVRHELALLRHHCSDWVHDHFDPLHPNAWQKEMQARIKQSVELLNITDKSHAKAYMDAVRQLHDSDILFPDAILKTKPKSRQHKVKLRPNHHQHRLTAFTDV